MTAQDTQTTGTVRLLIVEDDLASARLLRELLEGNEPGRFEIQHVTTAAHACKALEQTRPDLVILDLGLPDATELEALARLQSCQSEIPVIVLRRQS